MIRSHFKTGLALDTLGKVLFNHPEEDSSPGPDANSLARTGAEGSQGKELGTTQKLNEEHQCIVEGCLR